MTRQTKSAPPARAAATSSALSLVKRDVVDVVAGKIREFQASGQLHLPANYSPENAMKSAWLTLQEVKDKSGVPALTACTRDSVANSLLDMIVQGLNPAKKQCYFIAYGKTLICQRSYFGTMAVLKMVNPDVADIAAEVIYQGDELEYAIDRGRKTVTKHVQKFGNIDKARVVGAYCVVIGTDGGTMACEIMTIDEIKQSWSQSQVKPVDDKGAVKPGSTHGKFTAEMAKKTVINRTCKRLINASADSTLLLERMNRAEEIADEANTGEVIDIEVGMNPALPPPPAELLDCPATGTQVAPDECTTCGTREGCPAHDDDPSAASQDVAF